ncbi:MAG: ATP-binding protein [Gammaproteobacteria bacterium]|nr:ATP-binding protein [Gammaproteobacteria bacterium]
MSRLKKLITHAHEVLTRLEALIPPAAQDPDWNSAIAFRWQVRHGQPHVEPVDSLSGIQLDDLLGIDEQKTALDLNTRQFLRGLPANHALLWGPRGTGKSSLVKALLNAHSAAGLRLIEVDRHDLGNLPDIAAALRGRDEKFVLFCDDLSFDANDTGYKALKVALDGSVYSAPSNLLIYATSNRRHLLPEMQRDNLDHTYVDGEVHYGEAVEEKISLSERFGVWLAFHPFKQQQYLDIVQHWLSRLGHVDTDASAMERAALQWAQLHGSRSGRSAWQFAKDWTGRHALSEMGN